MNKDVAVHPCPYHYTIVPDEEWSSWKRWQWLEQPTFIYSSFQLVSKEENSPNQWPWTGESRSTRIRTAIIVAEYNIPESRDTCTNRMRMLSLLTLYFVVCLVICQILKAKSPTQVLVECILRECADSLPVLERLAINVHVKYTLTKASENLNMVWSLRTDLNVDAKEMRLVCLIPHIMMPSQNTTGTEMIRKFCQMT